MTTDMTAPATKQDIALLMEYLGNQTIVIEQVKGEIIDLKDQIQGMNTKIDLNHKGLLMKMELDRRDIFDVQDHRISQLDRRLTALEVKTT